jgi:hypothetical protein
MRNIGVFTARRVETNELVTFLQMFGARDATPWTNRRGEIIMGVEPDLVYILKDTALANGCADERELKDLRGVLGTAPASYIDLHFTSTPLAFPLADRIAREVKQEWQGVIDYSGAGGDLGTPP